jgi:hypothetical protein
MRIELNLTRNARKRSMRSSILRNAEAFHKQGLDSRVPFLKKTFGQEVLDGTTAKIEDGTPIRGWKEGDVVSDFHLWEALRFNTFNAPNGLQLVPFYSDEHGKTILKVIRCKTELSGDLKIAHLPERIPYDQKRSANGYFHARLYEVFLQTKIDPACRIGSFSDESLFYLLTENAFSHEMEHAGHFTLAKLSDTRLPEWKGEYLSMLSDVFNGYTPEILSLRAVSREALTAGSASHALASLCFVARLHCRYGMTPLQVKKAVHGYSHEMFSFMGDPSGLPILQRIRECARQEYEGTYRKIFGLDIEEIREIIADLPMI